MAENVRGRRPPGVDELPPLEFLLAIAKRRSDRCTICKWIYENRGTPTEALFPLNIGGVEISSEAQQWHLLSHLETDPE